MCAVIGGSCSKLASKMYSVRPNSVGIKKLWSFSTKILFRMRTANHSLVYFCTNSCQKQFPFQPFVSFGGLKLQCRMYSYGENTPEELSKHFYEKVSEETLENLSEVLDHLLEETYPNEFDVSLSNGVLTVQTAKHGTFVINKQTPNRQIWLSSPTSGPKRYNYVNGQWIYSHDKTSLDDLLTREFSKILNQPVTIISLPLSDS